MSQMSHMNHMEEAMNRIRELRGWIKELQSDDPHADRDSDEDAYNLSLHDLYRIELMVNALASQCDVLRIERNNARKWICEIIENPSLVGGLDRPRSKEDVAREQRWDCFG